MKIFRLSRISGITRSIPFNSLYPKYHISILWLPENVSWKQYGAYLSATAPDLFQYEFYFDASEFALQFSEGFRKTFTGKHFFFCEKQRPHSLLYAFSCAMTYWNQSLAEKYGLSDVRKRLRSGDYLGLLEEALQKIPEPYRIAGHVWDYLDGLGYPPGKPLLQRQFLETQLGRLLRFSGNLRAFYISQTDSLDAVRNFAHGHQLSVDTSPAAWQMLQPHASFKVECEPVHPLPRYHRGCSGLPISINKKCRYPATAELFLEHLLSEAVQRQLTLRRHLIPVRRSAWYYGAEQMFQMQEPAANLLIGQLDCKFSPSLKRFLTYAILDDLADLLERKVKLNLVLDQIMLKWEQYQKHK